jgi:hypothetical protein
LPPSPPLSLSLPLFVLAVILSEAKDPDASDPPIPFEPFNQQIQALACPRISPPQRSTIPSIRIQANAAETFTQNALSGNLSPTQPAIGYYQSDQAAHSSIKSITPGNA